MLEEVRAAGRRARARRSGRIAWARSSALALLLTFTPAAGAHARGVAQESIPQQDITELSIEQLLEVEIYSVSKRAEPLTDAAAAAYVLTADDIRRSGSTTIPEALRMVPGVQVARIDANKWAITARGFNGPFANKLLVMIDGRSVYTPLFSGVWWDVQDTLIEDIERIEVIRGPGSTLWGSNAVNGIINIITKEAGQTQGNFASLAIGGEERPNLNYRYGGALGDAGHWRAYGRYRNHASFERPDGTEAGDAWDGIQAGFRLDLETSEQASWRIHGDAYAGTSGTRYSVFSQQLPFLDETSDESDVSGGNLMAVYQRALGESSSFEFRSYYDRTSRHLYLTEYDVDILDVEVQHDTGLGARNHLTWGLGYRLISDTTVGSFTLSWDPSEKTTDLFSAFAQDEIDFFGDRLRLIFGAKVEHNDYSGLEVQPNVRFSWSFAENHHVWGAVTRAVRTPSRFDSDSRTVGAIIPAPMLGIPVDAPVVIELRGSDNFLSEKLIAYELGYRVHIANEASVDVAAAYNDYDDLRWADPGPVEMGPSSITAPWVLNNRRTGRSIAAEVAADWRPFEWLRLRPSYAYLSFDLDPQSSPNKSIVPLFFAEEAMAPEHQFLLWASLDVLPDTEIDFTLRSVDELSAAAIDSYVTTDLRVGWRPNGHFEVSLMGRNLIEGSHTEFVPQLLGVSTIIPRSGVLKVDLWF